MTHEHATRTTRTNSSTSFALGKEAKDAMLLESLQELTGGFVETCRRRLQEDTVRPDELLAASRHFIGALGELHRLVPQAKLAQRATRAAELLAKAFD